MCPLPRFKQWLPPNVVTHHNFPRSYVVEYNGKKYRRNRKHLCLFTYEAKDRLSQLSSALNLIISNQIDSRSAYVSTGTPNEKTMTENYVTVKDSRNNASESVTDNWDKPKTLGVTSKIITTNSYSFQSTQQATCSNGFVVSLT